MQPWQQKLGPRLMDHVRGTTENGLQREIRANLADIRPDLPSMYICWTCRQIAVRLGHPEWIHPEIKE